jgi:hypothetical protein
VTKELLRAKALLHADGHLEVEITPLAFDEHQARRLANGIAELIMKLFGDELAEDSRAANLDSITTH